MKEIYEAPELWLIGFVPGKHIAAMDWQWDQQVEGNTEETSAIEDAVTNNPEGGF